MPRQNSNSRITDILSARELYPFHHSLYSKALYSDRYVVKRFSNFQSLKHHRGCVNSVFWNEAGNLIISGSDDCRINIWAPFEDPEKPLIHSIPSGHSANIFSARFMPKSNDRHIISCSADGVIRYTDLEQIVESGVNWSPLPEFNCHSYMAFEVLPDPNDSNIFFSCSADGLINQYDLRIKKSCPCSHCKQHLFLDLNPTNNPDKHRLNSLIGKKSKKNNNNNNNNNSSPYRIRTRTTTVTDGDDNNESSQKRRQQQQRRRPESENPYLARRRRRGIIRGSHARDMSITAISIRPDNPVYMAAACEDTVRIYDRRYVIKSSYHRESQVYQFIPKLMRDSSAFARNKMTSLKFDPCGGGDLCASYSNSKIYLIRPNADQEGKSSSHKGSISTTAPRRNSSSSGSDNNNNDIFFKKKEKQKQINEEDMDKDTVDHNLMDNNQNHSRSLPMLSMEGVVGVSGSSDGNVNNIDMEDKSATKYDENNNKADGVNNIEFTVASDTDINNNISNGNKYNNKTKCRPMILDGGEDDIMGDGDNDDDEENDQDEDDEDDGDGDDSDDDDDDGDDDDDDDEKGDDSEYEDEYEDDNIYSTDEEGEDSEYEEAHEEDVVKIYSGHINSRTMIKEANFFGANSEYIMSGSDDGRIFIWDKITGEVVNLLKGDSRVVNCVQPHPHLPILCTSGIDSDVKIWYPEGEENDLSNLQKIIKNNELEVENINEDNDFTDSNPALLLSGDFIQIIEAIISQSGRHFMD